MAFPDDPKPNQLPFEDRAAAALKHIFNELPAPEELIKRITALLKQVGDPGTCKGCGAAIVWVTHKRNLKPTPYTPEGLNHFIDCPAASRFRKKKADANPGA